VGPLIPGSSGQTRLVTCVCVSSKWVEAWPTHNIKSSTIRALFHSNITTRYGVPLVVRSDKGKEFMGHFDKYLRELGVDHRVISTAHPRANGLIERYNRSIKEGLRKMSTLVGTIAWDEVLPEVLAGLRMLPTRLGVSPHLIVFK
jgi:transposase InsO family protein